MLLPRSINTSTQLRAPARHCVPPAPRACCPPRPLENTSTSLCIYRPETMSAWLGPTVWMLPMLYLTRSRVTVAVVTLVAWSTVSPVLAGGLLLTMLGNHPLSTLGAGSIRTEAGWSPGASSHQPPVTASTPHPHPAAAAAAGDRFPGMGRTMTTLQSWFPSLQYKSKCFDLINRLILF